MAPSRKHPLLSLLPARLSTLRGAQARPGSRASALFKRPYVFARRPGRRRAGDWRLDAERRVVVCGHGSPRVDRRLPAGAARQAWRQARWSVETRSRCTSASEPHRRHGDLEFRGRRRRGSAHNIGSGTVRVPSAMNGRELVWADGVEATTRRIPCSCHSSQKWWTRPRRSALDSDIVARTSRAIDAALGHYYGGRADAERRGVGMVRGHG